MQCQNARHKSLAFNYINMKYTFTKDNEEIEVPIEQWAWRVIYKPTDCQNRAALDKSNQMKAELKDELDKRVAHIKNTTKSETDIETLKTEFDQRVEVAGALQISHSICPTLLKSPSLLNCHNSS